MRIGIRYAAVYQYADQASFSPHLVRLFPRSDLFVRAERQRFHTESGADVQYRRDLFDNVIGYCFFPEKRDRLEFGLELDLSIAPKNPFHFILDSHALDVPFQYKPDEARVLAPYLQRSAGEASLPGELAPADPAATVGRLVAMVDWIFKNIEYERREEGEALTPSETLARGKGACRDSAVLMADALRANGVAARLASGFLWEPDKAREDKRAESALHAWVEGFVPGAGWIGIDPTNGVLCNEHFITTAVGIAPDDVSPIRGSYYGSRRIESRMEAKLDIVSL